MIPSDTVLIVQDCSFGSTFEAYDDQTIRRQPNDGTCWEARNSTMYHDRTERTTKITCINEIAEQFSL
jgi:hypothetical protein